MKFWIDIVNSPHVLFFTPIIERLRKQGHSVLITAREYAQTVPLLNNFNMSHTLIGAHAGANIGRKFLDVLVRSQSLYEYIKDKKIDRALTFNSPSLVLAARFMGLPSFVFMDYEYQPLNHLTFRFASKVIVPTYFPVASLSRFGAINKAVKYPGLKEQVYLSDFKPDPNFLNSMGIDKNKVIITARPPATMALYHQFENDLFYEALKYLVEHNNVIVLVIPRSLAQRRILMEMKYSNLIVIDNAVDGRNLIYYSDLVLSAGGTMNREAAILGTPAYTVFKGKPGAVDRYLMEQNRIVAISSQGEFGNIKIEKKTFINPFVNSELINFIINVITR
ncbi:MAG: DUF354 domain-containing protein [candidate division WOR-3 bacterium]